MIGQDGHTGKAHRTSTNANRPTRDASFKPRRKSSMTMISALIKAHHSQDSPSTSPTGKVGKQNLEALALASRGVETVLALVRNALGYGEMLQMPCNALKVLSAASPTHRSQIVEQGGIHILVECLRLHVKEPKIVVPVTRCLVNICGTPEGKNLLNRRGVQIALEALTSYGTDPVIQQSFSRVLRHICMDNPEAQMLLASEDCITRILDTITRNPVLVAVHRCQFSILVQLATNRALAKQIVEADGFQAIHKSISLHRQQIDVMTQCVGLLSFLTADSDSCAVFLHLQGMAVISGLLEQYLQDDAVLAGLCRIIYNVITCQAATDTNRASCLSMVLQILRHSEVQAIVQTALVSMSEALIVRGQNLGAGVRKEAFTQLLATMVLHLEIAPIQERCCFLCADICLNWTQEFWRQSSVLDRVYEAIESHHDANVHDAALEALHSIARITDDPWELLATERGICCLQRCMSTQPADALASQEVCCEGFLEILERHDDLRPVMMQRNVVPLVVHLFMTQLDLAIKEDDIPSTTCCELLAGLSAGSPGVFEVMNEVERAGAVRLLLESTHVFQDEPKLLAAVCRLIGNLATQDSICRTLMVLGAIDTFAEIWKCNKETDPDIAVVAALPLVAIAAHSEDFFQAVAASNALEAARSCISAQNKCSLLSDFERNYLNQVRSKFQSIQVPQSTSGTLTLPNAPRKASNNAAVVLSIQEAVLEASEREVSRGEMSLSANPSDHAPSIQLLLDKLVSEQETQTTVPLPICVETQTTLFVMTDKVVETDSTELHDVSTQMSVVFCDAATETEPADQCCAAIQTDAIPVAVDGQRATPDGATMQRLCRQLHAQRRNIERLEGLLMHREDVGAVTPLPGLSFQGVSDPDAVNNGQLLDRFQGLLSQLETELTRRENSLTLREEALAQERARVIAEEAALAAVRFKKQRPSLGGDLQRDPLEPARAIMMPTPPQRRPSGVKNKSFISESRSLSFHQGRQLTQPNTPVTLSHPKPPPLQPDPVPGVARMPCPPPLPSTSTSTNGLMRPSGLNLLGKRVAPTEQQTPADPQSGTIPAECDRHAKGLPPSQGLHRLSDEPGDHQWPPVMGPTSSRPAPVPPKPPGGPSPHQSVHSKPLRFRRPPSGAGEMPSREMRGPCGYSPDAILPRLPTWPNPAEFLDIPGHSLTPNARRPGLPLPALFQQLISEVSQHIGRPPCQTSLPKKPPNGSHGSMGAI